MSKYGHIFSVFFSQTFTVNYFKGVKVKSEMQFQSKSLCFKGIGDQISAWVHSIANKINFQRTLVGKNQWKNTLTSEKDQRTKFLIEIDRDTIHPIGPRVCFFEVTSLHFSVAKCIRWRPRSSRVASLAGQWSHVCPHGA